MAACRNGEVGKCGAEIPGTLEKLHQHLAKTHLGLGSSFKFIIGGRSTEIIFINGAVGNGNTMCDVGGTETTRYKMKVTYTDIEDNSVSTVVIGFSGTKTVGVKWKVESRALMVV